MQLQNSHPPSISMIMQRAGPIALIVANLIPLIGVMLWGWSAGALVTLYWAENLIVGGITLLKMFHKGSVTALPRMVFFLIHYGIFCIGHAVLLSTLVESHPMKTGGGFGDEPAVGAGAMDLIEPVVTIFSNASDYWVWGFSALLVSHVVSLFINYFGQQEYLVENLKTLMGAPYKRIMITHVVVLVGAVVTEKLGSPVYILLALVFLKTIVDVFFHVREHRQPGHAYSSGETAPEYMA